MNDVERIRLANPLVRVAREVTDLEPAAGGHVGRCPLHDDEDPSFHIYEGDGGFHCFGCQVGGDVFTLVQHLHDTDFRGALEYLADRAGIALNGRPPDPEEIDRRERMEQEVSAAVTRLKPEHREYLRGRGLTDETIARFRIGQTRNGHYLLPVLRYGRPIYTIQHRPDGHPKYRFRKGEERPIVGAEKLCGDGPVYVVEGYFDWAVLEQTAFDVVAVLGAPGARQVKALTGADDLVLLLDGDDAGREAAERLARDLYPSARVARLPDGMDPNDLAREHGERLEFAVRRLEKGSEDALQLQLARFGETENLEDLTAVYSLVARLPVNSTAEDVAIERVHDVAKSHRIRKSTIRSEVERARSEARRKRAEERRRQMKESGEVPDINILPPPTSPMAVAREVVDELYMNGEGDPLIVDFGAEFYGYDGRCWPKVEERIVRARCYRLLEDALAVRPDGIIEPWDPTRRKIADLIDALRAVVLLEGDKPPLWIEAEEDERPLAAEVVSMENGLLHVPTRELHDHTPAFFTNHALSFAFEPDAPKPERWLAFLNELWEHDASAIRALQEMFGYVLSGDTSLHKIFLLVGPKRAGKGTIGRVLTGLLGAHNVAAPTLASLSTNFGLQPLIGKPLGLISDARLSGRADGQVVVERLLSISGEDALTIDRKYRDPWTGRLQTRFVILTNELPNLSDSSGALASRFIVFPLTKSFYGSEDLNLTDKLLTEACGIFNWALDGLDRLRERGHFQPPESGKDAVRELEDLSSPISAFVRDHCVIGPEHSVPTDGLWEAWKMFCEDQNRGIGTKSVFGRNLKSAVPAISKIRPRMPDGSRPWQYQGIGLATENTLGGPTDHPDQGNVVRGRSGIRSGQQASNDKGGPGGPGSDPEPSVDASGPSSSDVLDGDGPAEIEEVEL